MSKMMNEKRVKEMKEILGLKEGMSNEEIKKIVFNFNKKLDSRKLGVSRKLRKGEIDKKGYEELISKIMVLKEESKLLRDMLIGRDVVRYEDRKEDEIKNMCKDEVVRGLNSIRSKKSRYGFELKEEDREKLDRKEEMYKRRYEEVKMEDSGVVEKSKISDVVSMLENGELSKEDIVKMLKNMI